MKKRDKRLTAADIAETALFVALMIAGVYIRIPIPVMPLTFQTVFAVLAGLLLGSKKGMIAMIVYAVLGLIGLPVFSDGGGFYYVIKPSFGYIIGFILTAAYNSSRARGDACGLCCRNTLFYRRVGTFGQPRALAQRSRL